MDPWTGTTGTFNYSLFRTLISNSNIPSHLFYYNPNLQFQNEISVQNQTEPEPMDFSGQNTVNIYRYFESCDISSNNRHIRSISNNNKYCKKSTTDGKEITIWKTLDKNTEGGSLKSGGTYIGTTSGVYLLFKRGDKINLKKFDDLDYRINDIILDGNGSAKVKANGLNISFKFICLRSYNSSWWNINK